MKTKALAGALAGGLLLASHSASAADPCEVIFCMAAKVAGHGGSECNDAIKSFFDIRKFTWKKHKGMIFNADATKAARDQMMGSCPDPAVAAQKDPITSRFGGLYSG